jgi:hypothetical protein
MGTPAQNNANRANAQHSTGPRSVEGKAAASRNSLKFGIHARSMIIPGEDAAALDELTAAYARQLQPVGPVEAALLKMLVRAEWMQQRYARAEAELLSFPNPFPSDSKHRLGDAIHHNVANYDTLTRIFRRQQAAQRDWYKAIETLCRLQTERRRAEVQAAAARPATPTPSANPNRVRFDNVPPQALQSAARATPLDFDDPVNLALRL